MSNDIHKKVEYVLSQGQTREHTCHWPGCPRQVPPALFMCTPHWVTLPKDLRNRIWAAYEPGQEVDMSPSVEYLEVAQEAEIFAREYDRKKAEAAGQLDLFKKP